jgi:hypothetical protein
VLLAIAPFTIGDLTQQRLGSWIKILPLLALVLILASSLLLGLEFKLFSPSCSGTSSSNNLYLI